MYFILDWYQNQTLNTLRGNYKAVANAYYALLRTAKEEGWLEEFEKTVTFTELSSCNSFSPNEFFAGDQ